MTNENTTMDQVEVSKKVNSFTTEETKMFEREITKQKAKLESIKKSVAEKYPQSVVTLTKGERAGQEDVVGPKPETLMFEGNKYKVEVICPVSGLSHWRYTSDLKQAQIHPNFSSDARKEKAKNKRELVKKLLASV